MTTSFIVREVDDDETDIAEMRRLVLVYAAAHASIPGVEFMRADAEAMPGKYRRPRGGMWLAVTGATGIGCVALHPIGPDVAEVKRMFVEPEWRGRGVARALLEALLEGARERGYRTVRLGTLDDMTAAQALYRSLGFVPIERYRPDELVDTRFYELAIA